MTYDYCDLAPNGRCPKDCRTSDGPLCDFDKCPYEKEADERNGIKEENEND